MREAAAVAKEMGFGEDFGPQAGSAAGSSVSRVARDLLLDSGDGVRAAVLRCRPPDESCRSVFFFIE